MNRLRWLALGIVAGLLSAGAPAHGEEKASSVPPDPTKKGTYQTLQYVGAEGRLVKYYLYLPSSYSPTAKLPLYLWMHGSTSQDYASHNWPPQTTNQGDLTPPSPKYPCVLVEPICNAAWGLRCWDGTGWNTGSHTHDLKAPPAGIAITLELVEKLIKDLGCDTNRCYVVGMSNGGYATWDLITYRPDLFAAAAPFCGSGDPSKAARIAKLPIWAFHSPADGAVPFKGSKDMIDAIVAIGGKPRFTVMDDAWGHNPPAKPEMNEMLAWMFSQSKAGRLPQPAAPAPKPIDDITSGNGNLYTNSFGPFGTLTGANPALRNIMLVSHDVGALAVPVLRCPPGAGLGTGCINVWQGIIELSSNLERPSGTAAGQMNLGDTCHGARYGGFSAYGADVTVAFGTIAKPTPLVWNKASDRPFSITHAFHLNSVYADHKITFVNPIDLAGNTAWVNVGANVAEMTGVLSDSKGTAGLTKTGTGTLILSADNSFAGASMVKSGGLVAAHANACGSGTGAITICIDSLFAVGNGVTFKRPVTFRYGSGLGGIGTFVRPGAWALNDVNGFAIRPGFGANQTGLFTLDTAGGAVAFGNNTLEIDFAGDKADRFKVAGGGALDLTDTTDTLVLRGNVSAGRHVIAEAAAIQGDFAKVDTSGLVLPAGAAPAKVVYEANKVLVVVGGKK